MRKPFSYLGDDKAEVLFNGIILLLIGPIYLVAVALMMIWGVIAFVLRFPAPKTVPVVMGKKGQSADIIFRRYVDAFRREIPGVEVDAGDDHTARFVTEHAVVSMWYDDYLVAIELGGKDKKLDCGYWHTEEEENIDMYFWYAVAALRGGVVYVENWRGRDIGWVFSKEMSIWVGVSTGSDRYHSSFTTFSRKNKTGTNDSRWM